MLLAEKKELQSYLEQEDRICTSNHLIEQGQKKTVKVLFLLSEEGLKSSVEMQEEA
jgi:hypothetical protein